MTAQLPKGEVNKSRERNLAYINHMPLAFSALTLFVGQQEGHLARKNGAVR